MNSTKSSATHQGKRISKTAMNILSSDCCGISKCDYPDGSNAKCILKERCLASLGVKRVAKPSHRETWQLKNNSVIVALGQQINLDPEWVSDMLFEMTLAKFQKLTDPKMAYWKGCRVPFVTFDSCDYYTKIFDRNMNLIFPMQPEALIKLIELLRKLDEESKRSMDNGTELLYGKAKKKSEYRSIIPNSKAIENGQRRRFNAENKDSFGEFDILNRNQANDVQSRMDAFSLTRDSEENQSKDPTGKHQAFLLKKDNVHSFSRKIKGSTYNTKDAMGVYDQFMDRMKKNENKSADSSYMNIKSLLDIPMQMAHIDETEEDNQGTNNEETKMRSRRFNRMKHRHTNKYHKPVYYYGEQVPILAHEPFDPERAETWIRRHPHAMRLADKDGTIVQDKPIWRYKRPSVRAKLTEARKRVSVRSEFGEPQRNSNRYSKGKRKHR